MKRASQSKRISFHRKQSDSRQGCSALAPNRLGSTHRDQQVGENADAEEDLVSSRAPSHIDDLQEGMGRGSLRAQQAHAALLHSPSLGRGILA